MTALKLNVSKNKILLIKFSLIISILVILYTNNSHFQPNNKNLKLFTTSDDQKSIDTLQSNDYRTDTLVKKVNALSKILVQLEENKKTSFIIDSLNNIEKDNIKTLKEIKNNQELLLKLTKIEDAQKIQINQLKSEINRIIKNNTTYLSFKFNYKDDKYSCFILNTSSKQYKINFHLKSSSGNHYESISNLYKSLDSNSNEVLMITNGGMYLQNLDPQGIYIEKSSSIKKLNQIKTNNNTNFYMFPNGVFAIDSYNHPLIMVTDSFSKNINESQIKYATQSGPMLLINNEIHPKFIKGSHNLNIRSGVGISSENNSNVLFIISNNEVNFYDFASVFKDLFHCKDALYLDGAISQMYLKDIDKNKIPTGHFGPLISVTRKK